MYYCYLGKLYSMMEQATPTASVTVTATKSKKAKQSDYHVPPARSNVTSTHWARYVYCTVKELTPHVLQRQEVCSAYNDMVAYMEPFNGNLATLIPRRYTHILYEHLDELIPCIYYTGSSDIWTRDYRQKVYHDMLHHYKRFYDLIADEFAPELNMKHHEYYTKKASEHIKRRINKVQAKIDAVKKECVVIIQREHDMETARCERLIEKERKRCEKRIALCTQKFEKQMEELNNELNRYIHELHECSRPYAPETD
jgi:hypothetical protein